MRYTILKSFDHHSKFPMASSIQLYLLPTTLGGLESSDGVVLILLSLLLEPETTAVWTHAAKLASCSSILSILTLQLLRKTKTVCYYSLTLIQ